jgi:hypothetical protein
MGRGYRLPQGVVAMARNRKAISVATEAWGLLTVGMVLLAGLLVHVLV